MNSRSTTRTLATASFIGAVAVTVMTTTTAIAATPPLNAMTAPTTNASVGGSSTESATAVCAGVPNCRVVAKADVDGDGHVDRVGWRQLSDRAVQIRVGTASGQLLTATVDVRLWWGGGAWAGAASVDGSAGVELLVGSMQGAHTPMYTMLTCRGGKLVVEQSPSPLSPLWQVDAADGDYMGWWRHTLTNGDIAMTQKIAWRIGTADRFRGHNVTYVWSDGTWKRTSSTTVTYATGKLASVIGGFHVHGLDPFPGVRR